jgi:hypothetical protein
MMDTVAIDAAGLGVLASLHRWAKRTRRTLKLMNLTPKVEHLLRLTKLNAEIEVCSAREMLELLCLAIRMQESERFGVPRGQDINNADGAWDRRTHLPVSA